MTPADIVPWWLIGAMGLVTLSTRVGGMWLGRLLPSTPFWKRFLEILPATLLVTIGLPAFLSGRPDEIVGGVVVFLAAWRGWNLVLVMALGMMAVAAMRAGFAL